MSGGGLSWVVLTMGDRDAALGRALDSIESQEVSGEVVVVANGGTVGALPPHIFVSTLHDNVGVPGGRDAGVSVASGSIIGFLDDDAELMTPDVATRALRIFADEPTVGAITLRIVDPDGNTARRHVPRFGRSGADRSGDVVTFLGGATIVRRQAYELVGGYWADLFYAHEELDLAWRLHDAGYTVRYLADARVAHPATTIARHPDGWWRTGRNRVMVARRNLPWLIALPHVFIWLVVGWFRAPNSECRDRYRRGWLAGWRVEVPRKPMRIRTVWRLTRLGRPPAI